MGFRPAIGLLCVFLLPCCKREEGGASTQYAIIKMENEKETLLNEIFSGKGVVNVCVVNDSPEKNSAWLGSVERAFEGAFKSWMAEGAKHPKYPLPKGVALVFRRIPSSALLKMDLDSARNVESAATDMKARIKALMDASDEAFPKAMDEYNVYTSELEAKNRAPLQDCPEHAVTIVAFSDPAAITAHIAAVEKASDLTAHVLTPEEDEALTRKFIRITYKGKMTYEEFKRDEELSKANHDELTRGYAMTSPPVIVTQQTSEHEQFLNGLMTHEMGHLFGLGDVYVDQDLQTDLMAHPDAIMGDHYSPTVQGRIQPDDVAGLFASITLAKTKVKACSASYHEFDNSADRRSAGTYYCLPDGFESTHFSTAISAAASADGVTTGTFSTETQGNTESQGTTTATASTTANVTATMTEATTAGAALVAPPKCPAGMAFSGASGVCCPGALPVFDPARAVCAAANPARISDVKFTFIGKGKYTLSFVASGAEKAKVLIDGKWKIHEGPAGSVSFDHTFTAFGDRRFEIAGFNAADPTHPTAVKKVIRCVGRTSDCAR